MAITEKVIYTYEAKDEMSKEVNTMKSSTEKLTKSVGSANKVLLGLGAAALTAVSGVVALTLNVGEQVDVLAKSSAALNMNVEDYVAITGAVGLAGVSQEEYTALTRRATKAAADNSDAFVTLGVSVNDSNGKMRSQKDILYETLLALEAMEPGVQRDALAMEIFGKNISPVNKLLDEGVESIATNTAFLAEHTSINEGVAKSYETMNDNLDILKFLMSDWLVGVLEPIALFLNNVFIVAIATLTGKTDTLTSSQQALSDKMQIVIDKVRDAIQAFVDFLPYMDDLFRIILFTSGVWFILNGIILAYNGYLAASATAIGIWKTTQLLMNSTIWKTVTAFLAQAAASLLAYWPILLIIAAIGAAIAIYITWKDEIDALIKKLLEFASAVTTYAIEKLNALYLLIRDKIIVIFNFLKDTIQILIDLGLKYLGIVLDQVRNAFDLLKNSIKFVIDLALTPFKIIIGLLTGDMGMVKDAVVDLANSFKVVLKGAIDFVMIPIRGLIDLFSDLLGIIGDVIGAITGGLVGAFNSIPFVPNIGGNVATLDNNLGQQISNTNNSQVFNYNIKAQNAPSLRQLRTQQFGFVTQGGNFVN